MLQQYSVSIPGRRPQNEDATLCWQGTIAGNAAALIAVADGMGGQAGGRKASSVAIRTLAKAWSRFVDETPSARAEVVRRFLQAVYARINRRVREHTDVHPDMKGMGTTLVVVVVVGRRAWVANVGDSRAYMIAGDHLEQVTDDHSALADSVRRGVMTEQEARRSPYRGALTRALDGLDEVEVDIFPVQSPALSLPESCFLFVCSDGLTGTVTEIELFECFKQTATLEEACETALAQAYHAGSEDNISLVALELGHVPRLSEPIAVTPLSDEIRHPAAARKHPSSERNRPLRSQVLSLGILGVLLLGLLGVLLGRMWWYGQGDITLENFSFFLHPDSTTAVPIEASPQDSAAQTVTDTLENRSDSTHEKLSVDTTSASRP